ncbi:hypothetical protein BTVI_35020 [Pitangus sulphuratus]|nr:hypothetical protein BTVI_35020 [Pitangus sulphuratus]
MTVRVINSQLTLNLHGIYTSTWIPANLWGLMGFILESLKSYLMPSQNLSIFEQSQKFREVPADWKLVNVVLILKKGKKEDHGNYRPVNLTSVLGKVLEIIILGSIEEYLKGNAVIGHSQHGFAREKSCFSSVVR